MLYNTISDILNGSLKYKELVDIVDEVTFTVMDENYANKQNIEYSAKDLHWFCTFYYPSQRFVIPIPKFNESVHSITLTTKSNVSLTVYFKIQ